MTLGDAASPPAPTEATATSTARRGQQVSRPQPPNPTLAITKRRSCRVLIAACCLTARFKPFRVTVMGPSLSSTYLYLAVRAAREVGSTAAAWDPGAPAAAPVCKDRSTSTGATSEPAAAAAAAEALDREHHTGLHCSMPARRGFTSPQTCHGLPSTCMMVQNKMSALQHSRGDVPPAQPRWPHGTQAYTQHDNDTPAASPQALQHQRLASFAAARHAIQPVLTDCSENKKNRAKAPQSPKLGLPQLPWERQHGR